MLSNVFFLRNKIKGLNSEPYNTLSIGTRGVQLSSEPGLHSRGKLEIHYWCFDALKMMRIWRCELHSKTNGNPFLHYVEKKCCLKANKRERNIFACRERKPVSKYMGCDLSCDMTSEGTMKYVEVNHMKLYKVCSPLFDRGLMGEPYGYNKKKIVFDYRFFGTISGLATNEVHTRMYAESRLPRRLRRVKIFSGRPPDSLPAYFHEHLSKTNSNPRSIIKLYQRYSRNDDLPDYRWLVRCLHKLGNVFGFNSFWSVRDRQALQSVPSFKNLMFDLIERKENIEPSEVPMLLYALAALEYRSWHLLPTILEVIEENIGKWRISTACNMALYLALLGIGDNSGNNSFGPEDNLSRDYSGLIERLAVYIYDSMHNRALLRANQVAASSSPMLAYLDDSGCSPCDKAGLAFAMMLTDLYECGGDGKEFFISRFLRDACASLTEEQLECSGWLQFFVYLCLYAADVEKPRAEIHIKTAVPIELQKSLHLRWLSNILVNGQPQGTELLQTDVDACLQRLNEEGVMINCSVGRERDEQHCFFASHLIKPRCMAIECDHLMPLGPDRPKPSGYVSCKKRIFKRFGLNVATVHGCFWNRLSIDQKDVQMTRLLSKLPKVVKLASVSDLSYKEYEHMRFHRHKRQAFTAWPPDKIEV